MKEKILTEKVSCDWCGQTSYEKCLGCDKDICWDCQKKKGVDYKHAVFFQGSGDGFYCNACLANPKVISTKLFLAYKEIANLRAEHDQWWKSFDIRHHKAEEDLKKLRYVK